MAKTHPFRPGNSLVFKFRVTSRRQTLVHFFFYLSVVGHVLTPVDVRLMMNNNAALVERRDRGIPRRLITFNLHDSCRSRYVMVIRWCFACESASLVGLKTITLQSWPGISSIFPVAVFHSWILSHSSDDFICASPLAPVATIMIPFNIFFLVVFLSTRIRCETCFPFVVTTTCALLSLFLVSTDRILTAAVGTYLDL